MALEKLKEWTHHSVHQCTAYVEPVKIINSNTEKLERVEYQDLAAIERELGVKMFQLDKKS